MDVIADVHLENAGKYKCLAFSILGKDENAVSLVVQSKLTRKLIFFFPGLLPNLAFFHVGRITDSLTSYSCLIKN